MTIRSLKYHKKANYVEVTLDDGSDPTVIVFDFDDMRALVRHFFRHIVKL